MINATIDVPTKVADAAFGVFENYEMVEAKYRGLDEI
jgi:hypothetical protein